MRFIGSIPCNSKAGSRAKGIHYKKRGLLWRTDVKKIKISKNYGKKRNKLPHYVHLVIDFFGITIWYRRSACTDTIF